MKTNKVIVVVEQDAEEVMVHDINPNIDPVQQLKELWQADLNTEIKESARTVDSNRSFCDDEYGEIWYATGTSPIKYFLTDVKRKTVSPDTTKEKKAIMMSLPDFTELIETLTDGLKTVEYEFGAYITHSDKADEMDQYNNEDATEILSRYFNKNVTSWHSEDNEENPQIWIVYE